MSGATVRNASGRGLIGSGKRMSAPMGVMSSYGNRPKTLLRSRRILMPAFRRTPADVEEAEIQENYGQIPGRLTDQGDRPQTPAKHNLPEVE